MRLAGLSTFSAESAIRRMTRGAAPTLAALSAMEVARPMLSRALVRPAQRSTLKLSPACAPTASARLNKAHLQGGLPFCCR